MKAQILKISIDGLLWMASKSDAFINVMMAMIHFALKNILQYRKSIIQDNLKKAFPSKSNQEISSLTDAYYQVIIKYIREIIQFSILTKDQIKEHIIVADAEHWNQCQSSGSQIIMGSHYGNWETNVCILPLLTKHRVVAFYKPIKRTAVDNLMRNMRGVHGLELYPIDQTARIMLECKGQDIWYIFISDQSPLNMNGVHWAYFLGVNTPWLNGAEKLAKKYQYPVYYLKQTPIHRDQLWYKLDLELISLDGQSHDQHIIMSRYIEILTEEIKSQPEYWLWSHRRWKRSHLAKPN